MAFQRGDANASNSIMQQYRFVIRNWYGSKFRAVRREYNAMVGFKMGIRGGNTISAAVP